MRIASPLALLALALVLGWSGPLRADFYRCRYEGREWIVNRVPKAHKRHCKLIMKTGPSPSEAAAQTSGGSAKAARKSRPKAVTPRRGGPKGGGDMPSESLMRIVLEAAGRYHLPPAFVLAVMKVESNFYPRAVSRVGAQGLMQLMPKTAAGLGVTDAFDPRQNIMGGCKYLRMLATRFDGDMVRTLAGYHAGGSAVDRKQGVPYAATDQYVRMVLDRYYQFKERLAAGEAE